MNHAEALMIVHEIAGAFPLPAWDDNRIAVWVRHLGDLDRDLCAAVVTAWIDTRASDRPPTLGELRQEVARVYAATADLGWVSVEEAWASVKGRIAAIGRYRDFATATSVKFPTPPPAFVSRIVETLGWETLCNTPEADLDTVVVGHFRRFYAEALAHVAADAAARPGAIPDPEASRERRPQLPPAVERPALDGPTQPTAIKDVLATVVLGNPDGGSGGPPEST